MKQTVETYLKRYDELQWMALRSFVGSSYNDQKLQDRIRTLALVKEVVDDEQTGQ